MKRCTVRHPQYGWRCTRGEGHDGNHVDQEGFDTSEYEPDPPGTSQIAAAVMGEFMPSAALKWPRPTPTGPIDYKTEWKPNSLNRDYWDEVLVGREIVKVNMDKDGIRSLTLDNGENIFCRNIYVIGDFHRKDVG